MRFFGIPVPKSNGQVVDYAEMKKPDFLYSVNIKLMQKFYKVLNQANANA